MLARVAIALAVLALGAPSVAEAQPAFSRFRKNVGRGKGPNDFGVAAVLPLKIADSTGVGMPGECGIGAYGTQGEPITVVRASNAFCSQADGGLVLIRPNQAVIMSQDGGYGGQLGLYHEDSAVNRTLWNNDMTQSGWAATNATVTKTATGPNQTANYCSTVTATAANATVIRALTLGSSQRAVSAYVQRVTGTGEVDLTLNNGSAWINIAATLTTQWKRFTPATHSGLTATLANPAVGIRLVASGDSVNVCLWQNESGAYATSPIETTTGSVTRQAVSYSVANPIPASTWCWGATATPVAGAVWNSGVTALLAHMNNGNDSYGQKNTADLLVDGTGLPYFITWDNTPLSKLIRRATAYTDASPRTMRGCDTAGTLSSYFENGVSGSTQAGSGTAILSTVPPTVYLGGLAAGSNFTGIITNFCMDMDGGCP